MLEIQCLERSCNSNHAENKKVSVEDKQLTTGSPNIFKELPKEEKTFPGKVKDWIKVKWNKTFKKKN